MLPQEDPSAGSGALTTSAEGATDAPRGREHPNERLLPYLPRLVVDWITDEPARRARRLDGTIVFIDISGFTKLSERLARAGNIGGEELAATIGSTFAELLAVAYANGGRLLKFGGDALLLLFEDDDHPQRACHSAVGMRRTLRERGALEVLGQKVRLRMSVGVHSGNFHFFLVGRSHRELVVTGPGFTETAGLEAAADAGEILISPATARAIPASLVGAEKGPGRLLRRAPHVNGDRSVAFPALTLPAGVDLASCIPAGLRASLLATSIPEHRRATIAFIHFDGTDELIRSRPLKEVARNLDELVTTVQDAADRNGVTFLATDVDRDGGKIILTAGVPSSSGDDERRMLLTVREVIDAGVVIPVRIGVNRGPVFAGDVGPSYRRTYTVMGDAVNLTARLMAHARPGEILATHEVLDRSPTAFGLTAVEPFFVKGKTKPVEAWQLGRVIGAKAEAATVELPFTGRRAELEALAAAATDATVTGRYVEIVGPAGIGKTRLVSELRSEFASMRQLSTRCELYEATTPYYPLTGMLRALLGLDPIVRDDADADRLRETVRTIAPDLVAWTPLLAAVTDVPMPETDETEQVEEQFRIARLGAVLRDVLTRLLDTPTLLLIEDVQWIDDASAELLEAVTADLASRPWLVLVTRRDEASEPIAAHADVSRIVLAPLPRDAAVALVRDATHDAAISERDIELLAERSTGNPLFLSELIGGARALGDVSALPDSVEALVAASIDRLPPQDRDLLRRIAVLGRTFPEELVPAVLDTASPLDESSWSRVGEYLTRESGRLTFAHAVVRDCAYEGLPYRARRELHSRVADAIRVLTDDSRDDSVELLSLHYARAERFPEAFAYSCTAADRAREIFADHEAAELYERALDAARRLTTVPDPEQARLRECLGDVRKRAGRFAEAESAFRGARRYVGDDRVAQARLQLKVAWIRAWLDRYSQALAAITRGLKLLDGDESAAAVGQRTQLLAWYGQFSLEGGHTSRAIRWSRDAIVSAEATDDREALAHALKVMGWTQLELGDPEAAENLGRSLALYEQLGDLPGQASVHNLLGGLAYWHGEWNEALVRYETARDLAMRTGNTVLGAFCTTNIGEIALDRGELELATSLFRDAARIWRVAGYRFASAFAKLLLGRALGRTGELAEALALLAESRDESLEVGDQWGALEASARIAGYLLETGENEEALRLADDALHQTRALGGVGVHLPLVQRVRGLALASLGRIDDARAAFEESITAGRTRNAGFEIALTTLALADITDDPDEHRQLRTESETILRQLGVRSVPTPYGVPELLDGQARVEA
jgi:class 3 adenylate cyclase/tetratricopeptide (TPR) repeat protein